MFFILWFAPLFLFFLFLPLFLSHPLSYKQNRFMKATVTAQKLLVPKVYGKSMNKLYNDQETQPRSQALSFALLPRWRKDPGLGWSRGSRLWHANKIA